MYIFLSELSYEQKTAVHQIAAADRDVGTHDHQVIKRRRLTDHYPKQANFAAWPAT